jgi:NADH-quinone oxidoreductase subunit L
MTRLTVLTFFGEPRGDAERHGHAHESPVSMTSALAILGVLSVVGGYVGVPHVLGGHNAIGEYLAPVLGHHTLKLGAGTEFLLMGASVGAAVLGIAAGWGMYRGGPQADASLASVLNGLYRAAEHSYYVDAFYQRRIVGGIVGGSRWLWNVIDVHVIDALANGVAWLAASIGSSLRRWSTGNVQHYALTFLVGMVALIGALMLETLR